MSTAPNSSRSSSSASASSSTKQTSSSVSTSSHQNNKEHQQQDNQDRTKAPTTFDSFAFCNSPQEVTSITKELLQQANKKNNMITATSITLLLVTLRDTAKSAESVFWMIKLLLSLLIIKKQNTPHDEVESCKNNKNTRTSLLVSNTFLNNPDLLCSSLQASSEYIKQHDGFLFWFMSFIKEICTAENEKLQKLLVSNEDFMQMFKELETHALHEQTKLIFSELNKNVFEKPENKFEWLQVLCRKNSIPEFPQTILKTLSQQMIRRQTFFALTEERLIRMKIPYGAILDMLTIIDGNKKRDTEISSTSATAMLSTSKKTKSIATAEQQYRGEEEKVVVVELNE